MTRRRPYIIARLFLVVRSGCASAGVSASFFPRLFIDLELKGDLLTAVDKLRQIFNLAAQSARDGSGRISDLFV